MTTWYVDGKVNDQWTNMRIQGTTVFGFTFHLENYNLRIGPGFKGYIQDFKVSNVAKYFGNNTLEWSNYLPGMIVISAYCYNAHDSEKEYSITIDGNQVSTTNYNGNRSASTLVSQFATEINNNASLVASGFSATTDGNTLIITRFGPAYTFRISDEMSQIFSAGTGNSSSWWKENGNGISLSLNNGYYHTTGEGQYPWTKQLITGDLEFTLIEDDLIYGKLNPNTDALLGSISNNTGRVGTVTAGTYTDIAVYGGSGTGAVATVITTDTDVTSVTIIPNDSHYTTAGSGYAIGDVLTISATDIGRESDNDLTFTLVADDIMDGILKIDADALLSSISSNTGTVTVTGGTHTDQILTGGSGSGAVATVVTSETDVTSVTITTLGTGYLIGDVLTISATDIESASPNDLEFTLVADDIMDGLLKIDADALLNSISNNTGVYYVTPGTYTNLSLSGGSGNGAIATVVITETDVTSVTITTEGTGYLIGDVLTISSSDIGRSSGNDLEFTLVADDIDDGTLKLDTDYLMSRITGNRASTSEIFGTYSDIVVNGGNNDAKATIVTAYNDVTPTYAYSSFLDIYTPTELYDNETPIFTPQEMKQIGYFARQILTSQYSYSNIRLSTKIDDSENFITVTNNQHNDEDEGTFFALGMLPIESWVNVFGSIPASTGTIYQVYKNNRSSSQVDIIAYYDGSSIYGKLNSGSASGDWQIGDKIINSTIIYEEVFTLTELYRNEKKLLDGSYEVTNISQAFTPHELKLAGYLARDILDIEITDGGNKAYPDETYLRGTKDGATAVEENLALISSDVNYNDLFTVSDLKLEIFTSSELNAGGYSARECKDAGYTARELLINNAYAYSEFYNEFTPTELYNETTRFTVQEMKDVGYTARQVLSTAYDYSDLYNIYSPKELYDYEVKVNNNNYTFYLAPNGKTTQDPFTISELKQIGYLARQVINIASDSWIIGTFNRPYEYSDLIAGGYTEKELYQNEKKLVDGSYEVTNISKPFTPYELKLTGFNARQILDIEITDGGDKAYQISDLRGTNDGTTNAGINNDLTANQVNYNDLFTVTELRIEIFTSTELKSGGYSASECKVGNYLARELLIDNAYAYIDFYNVYSPTELYNEIPRFTVQEMRDIGYLARQILTSRYIFSQLTPEFTIQELYENEKGLVDGSYELADPLVSDRFTVDELRQVGFNSYQVLTDIGNQEHISDLANNIDDYNYDDLTLGGYTATELKTNRS